VPSPTTSKTKAGRVRRHWTHSPQALEALDIMADKSKTPRNYLLDALIMQGYRRWLEDLAIQKKLEE